MLFYFFFFFFFGREVKQSTSWRDGESRPTHWRTAPNAPRERQRKIVRDAKHVRALCWLDELHASCAHAVSELPLTNYSSYWWWARALHPVSDTWPQIRLINAQLKWCLFFSLFFSLVKKAYLGATCALPPHQQQSIFAALLPSGLHMRRNLPLKHRFTLRQRQKHARYFPSVVVQEKNR